MKRSIIAMILVGGRGTRLKEITKDTAKPAVSFGAKYRLIDFTLSNLTYSNIDIVGLITQYEPYELMNYIGNGGSWDLDTIDGGISFLTPFSKAGEVQWQKGTAHAIKQYFSFIRQYQADHVLILSGDHIYKMDYQKLIDHHIAHQSSLTIATVKIDLKEADRFGILTFDENTMITNFEEKPKVPKSNNASMGIYVFKTDVLEALLTVSESEEIIDFGKNIIPKAIASKIPVYAYPFEGYWRDVGTYESLHQANMDMLDDPDFLMLNVSKGIQIYSKSMNLPPHIVLEDGIIKKSVIADGSIIDGTVIHSTVGYQSVVMKNARIENCVLLPNVFISENVILKNVIVNKNMIIPANYCCTPDQVTVLDVTNLMEVGVIDE
jgi:glucose-1-phosphate adenylyltransferase